MVESLKVRFAQNSQKKSRGWVHRGKILRVGPVPELYYLKDVDSEVGRYLETVGLLIPDLDWESKKTGTSVSILREIYKDFSRRL